MWSSRTQTFHVQITPYKSKLLEDASLSGIENIFWYCNGWRGWVDCYIELLCGFCKLKIVRKMRQLLNSLKSFLQMPEWVSLQPHCLHKGWILTFFTGLLCLQSWAWSEDDYTVLAAHNVNDEEKESEGTLHEGVVESENVGHKFELFHLGYLQLVISMMNRSYLELWPHKFSIWATNVILVSISIKHNSESGISFSGLTYSRYPSPAWP